jgi:hypothetical protein
MHYPLSLTLSHKGREEYFWWVAEPLRMKGYIEDRQGDFVARCEQCGVYEQVEFRSFLHRRYYVLNYLFPFAYVD